MKKGMRVSLMALVFGVALIVALMGAMTAFADTTTGTVTVSQGSLSVTAGPTVALPEVTLDGTDQESEYTASDDWGANDPTGTGSGWNVTIASSDFITGSRTIDISQADQQFFVKLADADITCVLGQEDPNDPTSSMTTYTALSDSGQKLLTAAVDKGMGDYDWDPDFKLEVRAETYADTYQATITVTIASGP